MTNEASQYVDWFRTAAPYIHVHRGKTFVIQFNDEVIQGENFSHLVHDLALLNSLGIRVVIVFGARGSIEQRLNEQGLSSTYHRGMRVTDTTTMEYVKEISGKLRVDIEAKFSMGLGNTPMQNSEVRVCSGNFVTSKPLGIIDGIDFLYTGEVRNIDTHIIESKLDAGEIVLIPPIGYSVTGEAYNISADVLAAEIAVNLKADKLIFLMDVVELQGLTHATVDQLTQTEAESLLTRFAEDSTTFRNIKNAINVCSKDVARVHLLNQDHDGVILQELFTRDGAGTMITSDTYDEIRMADNKDIAGIMELIKPLERDGILVERSREKLELEVSSFTIMVRDGVIIGCASLYKFASEPVAELACFAIHPDYHNSGRGEQLYMSVERQARESGIEKIFVLTTRAEHWFLEQGFCEATLEDLPMQKKEMYNYQRNSRVLINNLDK